MRRTINGVVSILLLILINTTAPSQDAHAQGAIVEGISTAYAAKAFSSQNLCLGVDSSGACTKAGLLTYNISASDDMWTGIQEAEVYNRNDQEHHKLSLRLYCTWNLANADHYCIENRDGVLTPPSSSAASAEISKRIEKAVNDMFRGFPFHGSITSNANRQTNVKSFTQTLYIRPVSKKGDSKNTYYCYDAVAKGVRADLSGNALGATQILDSRSSCISWYQIVDTWKFKNMALSLIQSIEITKSWKTTDPPAAYLAPTPVASPPPTDR